MADMVEKFLQQGIEVIRIGSNCGSVRANFVPAFGGTGSSLQRKLDSGKWQEFLFLQDEFWGQEQPLDRGGLPFLFPACGRHLRDGMPDTWLWKGRRYPMPLHGFSLCLPWELVDTRDDSLTLELTDSPGTREAYPFAFRIRLTWRVHAQGLTGLLAIHNPGPEPLPFTAGFHPYFLTPPAGEGKDEVRLSHGALHQLEYNASLNDIAGKHSPPASDLSISDPALQDALLEVAEGHVSRLDYPGGQQLEIQARASGEAGVFKYLQFYSNPGKPFICVEPWTAHPNAFNTLGGTKWIVPGDSFEAVLDILC